VEKNEENNLTSLSNIHLQNGCMLNKVRKEGRKERCWTWCYCCSMTKLSETVVVNADGSNSAQKDGRKFLVINGMYLYCVLVSFGNISKQI